MKSKKIPLRTCIITREKLPKNELLRVVKNKAGEVFVDDTHKANGRGAYLKKDKAVILKAQKSKKLNQHLGITIPDGIYDTLLKCIES
jgi:predicted RNA-binding protein YlxR (DUF448 family)